MARTGHLRLVLALAAAGVLEHCASMRYAGESANESVATARGGGPRSDSPRASRRDDDPLGYGGPHGFRAQGGIPPYGPWGWMYLPSMEYYGGRGDNRWRYYDGARPAGVGGSHWYGGPPYDRPGW